MRFDDGGMVLVSTAVDHMMFPLELTRPWLLVTVLPMLIAMLYFFVRSLSDFPKSQRIVSLAVRSLIVLLLGLSLAGLTLLHRTEEQFVMFVTDQSQSIGDESAAKATSYLSEALANKGSNRAAHMPFGAIVGQVQEEQVEFGIEPSLLKTRNLDASSEKKEEPQEKSTPVTAFGVSPKRDGTHLAAAIETAAGYMPTGYVPHIIVLSDGNETVGDASSAATRSRVRVSTVLLPTRTEPEVQVSQVNVPAEVREGEPFFVEVSIQSNHEDNGLVEVFRGDHKVISEMRELKSGLNVFRFPQSIDRDRLAGCV